MQVWRVRHHLAFLVNSENNNPEGSISLIFRVCVLHFLAGLMSGLPRWIHSLALGFMSYEVIAMVNPQ